MPINIDIKDTTTMDVQSLYLSKGFTLEDMNNLKFVFKIIIFIFISFFNIYILKICVALNECRS